MSATAPVRDNASSTAQRVQGTPGGGLLATKLCIRPARGKLVARPHLIKLLDDGCAASLILVSAPAGFGKTTLLAAWLGRETRRAGWLSLDAADNDPARFLAYVVAALQRAVPGVAGDLAGQLRSAEPPVAEAAITTLVNELALVAEDVTLVLDDYHVVTAPAVNAALAFLLDHLPPNLHLVIASRADPPIPLARLRSRGQVVEIRGDDLRFTPGEAAAFLGDTMGLSLTPEQAAVLDERAEGWIAGLQMAALSMRGREDVDGFIRAFAGTNRFILDFLVEEVLAREPEEVQSFLLQTAVLSRLCGPLCDAVTGRAGGQEMLERLERRNLFVVPLDDDRRWYRYHHLFADLLQARLRQSGDDQAAALMARAAAWCEREGEAADAVDYALAARDYTRAGDLIARCWGGAAGAGEIETVWSWLSALPENVVSSSAPLSVACCWTLWLRGQFAAMATHLENAERAPAGQDATLAAQVATLRAVFARHSGDFAAARTYAERAAALLPENLHVQADARLRILIHVALATACDATGDLAGAADAYAGAVHWSRLARDATGFAVTFRLAGILRVLGRLRAADAACRAALGFVAEQGMASLPAAGILHVALADVLVERNELQAAEEHLARGAELGRHSGRLDAAKNAAAALARLRLARGDMRGALAAVEEAEGALGGTPFPLARAELCALKASLLARQGSLSEAAQCVEDARRLAGGDQGLTGETVALAATRVFATRRKPAEAVPHLTRALADAQSAGRLGAALELRILRSMALARQGRGQEAEAELERTLAQAEPEGYVRVFADEGELLAGLLRGLAARPAQAGGDATCSAYSAGYVAALLAACRAPGRTADAAQAPALAEPLSGRELEVLALLAEGLSNEQIAARLIIALGTAKAHVHNIAAKLGAQNRAHAVARAKELGLL
jgi:LuxR family maltose regulon positive regulatory protein